MSAKRLALFVALGVVVLIVILIVVQADSISIGAATL